MKICKKCNNEVVPNNYCLGYYCYKCGNVKHSDIYISIKKDTKVRAKDNLKMNGSSLIFAIKDKTYSISNIEYEFIDEQGNPHTFSEDFIMKHLDVL